MTEYIPNSENVILKLILDSLEKEKQSNKKHKKIMGLVQ